MARDRGNTETVVEDSTKNPEAPQGNGEASGLVFEAPPTVTRSHEKSGKYEALLAQLRENADKWARLTPEPVENPNSLTAYLKSGRAKGVNDRFDFVSRTTEAEDDKGHVYAIFLGDENYEVKRSYDEISTQRRKAIKEAKSALPDDATDEQKDEAVKALDLPKLPERTYMP